MALYDKFPGVDDETFRFPPLIRKAQADSPENESAISRLVNLAKTDVLNTVDTLRLDLGQIIADNHAYGPTLPSDFTNIPPGRLFFRTADQVLYISDGVSWNIVGGTTRPTLAAFGYLHGNYDIPSSGTDNWVRKNGNMIDFRIRFVRKDGAGFPSGSNFFYLNPAFLPFGIGFVPVYYIASSGANRLRGAQITAGGQFQLFDSDSNNTAVTVFGSYPIS